jgi:hypothetical protein
MADEIEQRDSHAAGTGGVSPRRWGLNVLCSIVASASVVLTLALPAHGSNHLRSNPGPIAHQNRQRPPTGHAPAGGPKPRVLAIVVGATNDNDESGIGSAVVTNLKNIRFLLGQMRSIAHLDTEEFDALDDHFDCQRINDILAGKVLGSSRKPLSVRRGVDTVLFYYAGHGYRDTVATDKFPILWCSQLNGPPLEDLRLTDIMGKLFNLGPRLAIGIADACNYAIGQESAGKGLAVPTEANLRALFAGYRGMVTMSAAKSGTTAWYSVVPENNPGGGFFSNKLLRLINTQATWEAIEGDLMDPDTQDPIVVPGAGKNGASVIQQPIADDYHEDARRALRRLPLGG